MRPYQRTKTYVTAWRVLSGTALAAIALLIAVGSRVVALLFSVDFQFQPYELAAIPIAIAAFLLCRPNSSNAYRRIESTGRMMAIFALIVASLVAVVVRSMFVLGVSPQILTWQGAELTFLDRALLPLDAFLALLLLVGTSQIWFVSCGIPMIGVLTLALWWGVVRR
jgi:hypothetical protein